MVTSTVGHIANTLYRSLYAFLSLSRLQVRAASHEPAKHGSRLPPTHDWQAIKPTPTRTVAQRLPNNTWDGHMHVIDPSRYPLAPNAVYTPSVFSAWDAVSFENSVSMRNLVAVQPSIYGNDNSALLDALRAFGPDRSRGVVVFDDQAIDNATLQQWHDLGVRGVRLNLASTGAEPDLDEFMRTMRRYADRVKPFGWMVQVYMSMDLLPALVDTIKELPVRFCLDHFARPSGPTDSTNHSFDPYNIKGFSALMELLQHGNTWVKFSAPYRVELEPDELDALAREILRVHCDRAVFATDWPHTRFEGLDIKPFEERCLEWAEEARCVDQVFSLNAKELWDVRD